MCVAGVRTYVFNVFVSSTKRAPLQCQKCSSPDQHKTLSSLAINMFVCSVMSCLEVSSRGCLVASDEHVRLQCDIEFRGETSCILKVSLENPPKKEQKLGGKVSEQNFISSRDGAEKSTETRPG